MKGGFLDKAIAREAATKPKKEQAPGLKEWDEKTLDVMVKVLQEILEENSRLAKNDLERRIRSGTGVRAFVGRCCGAPDTPVPGEDEDVVSRLLRDFTKPTALRDMVAPVMEQTVQIFGRVQSKGQTDGLTMDSETEVKVTRDIIKECLIRHILKLVNTDNSGGHASGSHDAGLLATPQGYFGGDLNSFNGDMIRSLMEQGYGFQDDFVDDSVIQDVYNEIELMDFDGKLTEVQQQKMTGYRTDRIHWLTYDALDREKQPGLVALLKKMISIPFELNKKCSLYLQASASFQVACYPEGAFYRRHVDGGYDETNNGRKISAVLYANKSWSREDGGQLRVFKRRPNPFQVAKAQSEGAEVPDVDQIEVEEEIEPMGGRMVLFRSRDMPHEVLPCRKKRFAISLWLMGPPGPGDQPDDHHTPT
mmetsp:Transcript_42560/g.96103  ORF Transcript_42560/g.96103 Transcript_42560/m.96103 type:complete len:420 (+) Transcript_42560:98-1357(+)|eukprot:CAMPEP_0197897354 /NCGR_PEP_ID=MMETSP1439-20131203/42134_1 /TAXON_ID=66791 /ORGANISM="Gonyaulax spinifera, Strain CCMP409" /LENGTH=419 /DNA_ID=CAMNT_0043517981 /DNA_START=111 /DNA_END=1370 /DNA_ORIENTATION=-